MPHSSPPPTTIYPLPQPLAKTIATSHQQSLTALESTLQTLTEQHTHCGPSGGPITTCLTHGGPWRAVFKTFYLPPSITSPPPVTPSTGTAEVRSEDTWIGCRPDSYREEIENMFEREDLKTISERVERERKAHVQESQITSAAWESEDVKKARERAGELWLVGKDADAYLSEVSEQLRSKVQSDDRSRKLNEEFSSAATREEQRAILRRLACDSREGDTAADAALRQKWTRLFDNSQMAYEDIENAMKHDVEMARERVAELDTKLADLQSAYMAESRKKEAEEEEKRRIEKENERRCEACGKELEVVEEGLCCEKCWEEKRDDDGRLRMGWYCGEDCARRDAARHNAEFHGEDKKNMR